MPIIMHGICIINYMATNLNRILLHNVALYPYRYTSHHLSSQTVLHPSPLKILLSRVFHLYSSLLLISLLGNFWLKTVFVLEWPILKCLHTIKECQVAYAKTYLNMKCNEKFGCALRNITSNVSVMKYWASWSFPDKNPPSRKEIISNFQWGDYCKYK